MFIVANQNSIGEVNTMWKWAAIILFFQLDILIILALYDHGKYELIPIQEVVERKASQETRDWKALSLIPEEYRYHTYAFCLKYSVPVPIFCALVQAESEWNPSTVGANSDSIDIGLCQLNSKNKTYFEQQFKGYTVYNPIHNLEIGAWFLGKMYKEHKSWTLALAAYNAGSHAVKTSQIPRSTKKYVLKIWTWIQNNLKNVS